MVIHKTHKQAGFTLVELVVVIIILGILAAVALPKFMDVTDKAHYAAVGGASGGLGAGVALFHAQYVANGHTGIEDDVVGFGDDQVDANANGWPSDAGGAGGANGANVNSARCERIWYGVMQSPPSADNNAATNPDYLVTAAGTVCTYAYQPDTAVARSITYDSSNGTVSVTNPKP